MLVQLKGSEMPWLLVTNHKESAKTFWSDTAPGNTARAWPPQQGVCIVLMACLIRHSLGGALLACAFHVAAVL